MSDRYDRYLRGVNDLLQAIEPAEADHLTALTLQNRLVQAIAEIRRIGPTDNTRAEINRVTDELNRVCLNHFQKSFNSLCEVDELPKDETDTSVLPLSSIKYERYLERLQSQILNAFHRDQYVMLTVEALESEDSTTLSALQQALRSAFDIKVEEGMIGRGKQEILEDAVAPHRLVALLGDPGIGKTTSLRSIALQQIEHVRTGTSHMVPVWISLGKWNDKEIPAQEFLWYEFIELFGEDGITRDIFEILLTQGRLLLLLDGLNELPQRELETAGGLSSQPGSSENESAKKVFDPRENDLLVLARETQSQFLLSCRVLEYTHLPGWREFRILPLNNEQIVEFAQQHLGQQSQRFETILEQQSELRELVRNPFFLRSLIRLVQEDWHQVPMDRFELVQYTCWASLHREARRREVEAEQVANLLGEMSLDSMADGWIGSWFHFLLDRGPELEESERSQTLTRTDAMRCAEGAGLVIRIKEDAEQIAYQYLHQLVQESLALIYLKSERLQGADYPEAQSLARVGEIHLDWGKLSEAQENFLRALELCPTVGADTVRATILLSLSKVYRFWRQSLTGLEYAEIALQLLDRTGDTVQLAEVYHELGSLNQRLRRRKEAEKNYCLSLEVYERLGDQSKYAYEIIYGLADFYSAPMVYKIREAMDWYEKALQIFEEQNDAFGIARTELGVAHALRLWGKMDRAEESFQICTAKFERLEQPWLQIDSLEFWGYTLRDARRLSEAEAILEKALDVARQKNAQSDEIDILIFGLAWVASYQGKHSRALELLDEALGLVRRQANPIYLTRTYGKGFGYTSWRAKDFQSATHYFLLCDKTMDEEYRRHLDPIDRLGIKWAKILGVHTDAHRLARLVSGFFWTLSQLWERYNNPLHWFGRQLYRFGWWLYRF